MKICSDCLFIYSATSSETGLRGEKFKNRNAMAFLKQLESEVDDFRHAGLSYPDYFDPHIIRDVLKEEEYDVFWDLCRACAARRSGDIPPFNRNTIKSCILHGYLAGERHAREASAHIRRIPIDYFPFRRHERILGSCKKTRLWRIYWWSWEVGYNRAGGTLYTEEEIMEEDEELAMDCDIWEGEAI